MKYSLRTLMIVVPVLPPLIAVAFYYPTTTFAIVVCLGTCLLSLAAYWYGQRPRVVP